MKKNVKLVKYALMGVLSLGLVSTTFTSCKDYDDDINHLQEQIDANKASIADIQKAIESGKWVSSYNAITNGYELVLSDGSKLTITNGKDGAQGEKGEQGLQGLQGPKGEAGTSIIPKFQVSAEGFWQVSVDDGSTWENVLDVNGEQVKATGENGKDATSNVEIAPEGYIKIGDKQTSFKFDANIPSVIYNETAKTVVMAIDGKSYTLLQEGSAFKGLQSIVYRKKTADDARDFVYATSLYSDIKGEKVVLAAAPGMAEFKVFPKDFDLTNAKFLFSDTYETKAAAPSLTYLEGSATLKNGILKLSMIPSDMAENKDYASSLDVTMYKQYTSASNYFNVRVRSINMDGVNLYTTRELSQVNTKQLVIDLERPNTTYAPESFRFDYTKEYSLADSVQLGTDFNNQIALLKDDLGYTDEQIVTTYAQTTGKAKGIFELSKEGIIKVKSENQASAINEVCFVTVTYTIGEMKISYDLAVRAVRPTVLRDIELFPLKAEDLANVQYSVKTQVVKLDVRKFLDKMGGRDVVNPSNQNGYLPIPLIYKKEINGQLQQIDVTSGAIGGFNFALDYKDIATTNKGVFLAYRRGATTDEDALYLIFGPRTILPKDAATLYTSYSVNNTNLYIDNVTCERNVTISQAKAFVDSSTGLTTIVGKWNSSTDFSMEAKLTDLYIVTPSDMVLDFVLAPKAEQPQAVQDVYDQLAITLGTNGNYINFKATPTTGKPIDVAKLLGAKGIKFNVYDHAQNEVISDRSVIENANALAQVSPVLRSPLDNITIKSGELKWTINDNPSTKTYNTPVKAEISLKDRCTNTAANTIVTNGTIVNNNWMIVPTYGMTAPRYALTFTPGDLADEKTFTINQSTGVITCNNTTLKFKTTLTVNVAYRHSWGVSTKDIKVVAERP
ncbi:PL29 family lyase N-terminal domain-containing protein [Parabacteroides pacaensis]|uniref:PL29 family lyase N-terminal domain-containing protein n=1 Tax=Parabacteroides pacaensis TaxID=2086575 RepID=UPI000D0FEDBC|nr:PL29 family lyase N-terminal domain-containing protein [Parabacteroides pacaensis]